MSTPNDSKKTGLPPGVEPGPLGSRLVAYVIEHALPAILVAVSSGVALGTQLNGRGRTTLLIVTIVVSLGWGLFVWRMYALQAAGPGMRVAKLQLVGYRDGRPIGWSRFLLRWLVLALLSATVVGLVIMLIVMARQARQQGWHDLAADSVVIKQRPLAPPRQVAATAASPGSPVSPVVQSPATSTVDQTAAESPVASSAAPSAAPSGAVVDTDEDLETAETSRTRSAQVSETGAARPMSAATWVITFDDGWDLAVDGLILLGRNPQLQPGEEDAQAIKIADETRTVSKTHLAVGVDTNGLYVMDRGSTNGSTVTTVDGFSMPCAEGDVIAVEDGAIVSFGDHWFRVSRD